MQLEEPIENGLDEGFLYSEQHLRTLAYDQIWKGKGVEHDPFIIENANVLGQTIFIKKSALALSFKNCNFDQVLFETCENVSMHNCTFRKLSLKRCKEFEFDSCYISDKFLENKKG